MKIILQLSDSYLGLVLFLEEDHYVSEDFLHVLKLVEVERGRKYSNCDIICLGTYLKSYNYNRNHKSVSKIFDLKYEIWMGMITLLLLRKKTEKKKSLKQSLNMKRSRIVFLKFLNYAYWVTQHKLSVMIWLVGGQT